MLGPFLGLVADEVLILIVCGPRLCDRRKRIFPGIPCVMVLPIFGLNAGSRIKIALTIIHLVEHPANAVLHNDGIIVAIKARAQPTLHCVLQLVGEGDQGMYIIPLRCGFPSGEYCATIVVPFQRTGGTRPVISIGTSQRYCVPVFWGAMDGARITGISVFGSRSTNREC